MNLSPLTVEVEGYEPFFTDTAATATAALTLWWRTLYDRGHEPFWGVEFSAVVVDSNGTRQEFRVVAPATHAEDLLVEDAQEARHRSENP